MNILQKEHEDPNTGDIVGCSDGDIGIVLKCHYDNDAYRLMVEVAWNSGRVLTDPWDSEDFQTADDLFHIMSRA